MPRKIEITHAKYVECEVADELKDGYLAFTYPGKFIGYGETMEEALIMARMRYRSAKKSFLDTGETESSWVAWMKDREYKMNVIHEKWGIKDESTWNVDNVDKATKNGET